MEVRPVTGEAKLEKALSEITERLTRAFGDRLVSAILYGSAVCGDYNGDYSDLNVLCVLKGISANELRASEPIFRWWRERGNPAPLLLSETEVRTSTDCFAIEFHDMKERRRVLAGADVVADLEIDDSFYRAQVEHELRAKLLRLRQKSAGVLADRDLLLRLMADSVSTFCVLLRHALRLHGHSSRWIRREIVDEAMRKFQIDPRPFLELIALREGKLKPAAIDPLPLFESYLAQIGLVIEAVDKLEK